MLKWTRATLPLMLISALAVGCGDDDGTTGPTINDLAADWNMTAGTLTPNNAQIPQINLATISTIELDIAPDGDFELTVDVAGAPAPTVITGTLEITGANTANIINDADPGNPLPATFSLTNNNNTLTVQVNDAELLDITGDGQVTEADAGDLNITFARETT